MMNKTYIPLHVHSSFSLLDGMSSAKDIAKRLVEAELIGSAITDHGNISGVLKFYSELKKKDKKSILGCELYICEQHSSIRSPANSKLQHLVVLSKNLRGWKELLKIVSRSNHPESFYRKPRLSLEEIAELNPQNLIAISGHLGSHIANSMFVDSYDAARKKNEQDIRAYLRPNCVDYMKDMASKLQNIFGKDNFFLEIQLIDQENLPINKVIAKGLRYLGQQMGIKRVGTPDAHYCRREDAEDQRILLCTSINRKIKDVYRAIERGEEVPLSTFFKSNNYHIPTYNEMVQVHQPEELENTLLVADMCENYDITNSPDIPKFQTPDGLSSIDYLRKCVKEGFDLKQKDIDKVCRDRNITIDDYRQRYKKEEQIIAEADLADYFLILKDILDYARNNGQLCGVGRGSSSGCLISYLLQITDVDPLQYDLLFERFYNSARRGNLPDIDCDVEKFGREAIIKYIIDKYGKDRVAKIATFGSLQGKAVVKDVFRGHGISFDEVNEITKFIPDPAKISGEIQEQHDLGNEDYGTIDWALDNNIKELSKWVVRDQNTGQLSGPLSKQFMQAIRLEGCYKSVGVHAAGIIISNQPIEEVCPLIRSSDGELICGFDKKAVEEVGLCKLDLLGLSTLDRLHIIEDLINNEITTNNSKINRKK